MKELLKQLRETREFQEIMDAMSKHRPVIPEYRPAGSREANDGLIETIKYESGRQDGFDLLFKLLTGK